MLCDAPVSSRVALVAECGSYVAHGTSHDAFYVLSAVQLVPSAVLGLEELGLEEIIDFGLVLRKIKRC